VEEMVSAPQAEEEKNVETFTITRVMLNYVIIAIVFFGTGLGIGAIIFNNPALDRAELSEIVRQAVMEAGGVANAGGNNSRRAALVDDDPYIGAEDAPITIVEFSDFNCPYCAYYVTNTLPQILAVYGEYVRYVYRDMPIVTQESFSSSLAANCAFEQDKFWDYHDTLFANPQQRGRDAYIKFATDLGLNVDVFTTCFDEQKYKDEVTLDWLAGDQFGVDGTPAFFINDRFMSGAQAFERFALVIDTELKALGIEPPAR
jgi:protein-disulfide isomerase